MFNKINKFAILNAMNNESNFIPFGIIVGIGFSLYYFVWVDLVEQPYENFYIRLIAVFLCFSLALKNYWPVKLKVFLPYYWYITLIYTLSFFFTFMLLKNGTASIWPMNTMVAGVFLILLTDWISLSFVLITGLTIAIFVYNYSTPDSKVPDNVIGLLVTYIPLALAGTFFVYRKERIQTEKLKTISMMGESIAHELRTPLRTIQSGVNGLHRFMPTLIESYNVVQEKEIELENDAIDKIHFQMLTRTLENMTDEVRFAFTFIDMLLMSSNVNISPKTHQQYSMINTVNEALARYPFDTDDRTLVQWHSENDFMFYGDDQLIIHVLFNLLKNAIYYVRAANKGEISIWLTQNTKTNQLHFKDTGQGIAKKVLPYIFDRFFSKTYHGTGIGLAFCDRVMKNLGGDIQCQSIEGEFSEFILTFPKQREKA